MTGTEISMNSSEHPLIDSMRRAAALNTYFELPVRSADEHGWIDAPSLFAKDDQMLYQMVMANGRDRWGTENPHVAGSAFIIAYLTRVVWPVVGQYVLERRVPRVTLDNLVLHRDGARIVGTALKRPAFVALPRDVAASHPDAEIVSDKAALYARLKESLFESNLSTVIAALRRAARASIKVSENAVGASCAQAFHRLYYGLNDPDRVAREAQDFFSDPTSSVYGQVTLEVFEHQAKRGLFARRAGCCLWWRSPRASDYCSNCILLPHQQQDERFREMLAGRR
jgi:hypothetical protein